MLTYISNCRLYHSPEEICHLALEEGKIVKILSTLPDNGRVLFNANKNIVAPGLIDTHVHGAGGANPTDGKADSLHTMAKTLCKLGTTAFTATSFYFKHSDNAHLQMMGRVDTAQDEADCLGIHLEGPFIHPHKKGGIATECLADPDRETLSDVLMKTSGKLAIMTIAPELSWNDNVIQICKEFGIVASFGHSYANNRQAKEGFEQGMSLVTHLNNAMRKYDQGDDSPFRAILESDAYVQMITDGEHLDEKTIKTFYESFTADRIVLITDGIESCGLPDGEYTFNGIKYRSENGLAFYSDGSGKIGTSLSLFEIMMRFKRFTGCSLQEAIRAASENPAKCLHIDDRKGFINLGYDADLILIDENDRLANVLKNGKVIL
ncbi:MAG: N-acetylglucosamine-6-phosphate deacetylase [Candidatus Marinimicrobia bacterium]|nr:N-acetylglucosamine-6-phosphate deacetylase [Candidatus Neomarinimicrobiota bacterium]